MKIVFTHPTGNENSKAAVNSLMRAGLLNQFQTSIASFPGTFLDNLGAYSRLSEIRRRRFDPILKPITKMWPLLETGRLISNKLGLYNFIKHEEGQFSVDAVYKNFDKNVASSLVKLYQNGVDTIYSYEDAAEYSFRKSKELGIKCFYDLPIGYWRSAKQLLEAEKERWPEWSTTMTGFNDSEAKLARKDSELSLADKIFVASKFTATTLANFTGPLAPIEIIPYGFPKVDKERSFNYSNFNKPLKLLFVGSLSQRKGIADVFAAIEAIGASVELTVIGRKVTENCIPLNKALSRHKWIPSMSHDNILKTMQQHDVLLFPSLFEGFGLVITEAMSQGMPVITTERTCGPDIIKNNVDGWIIKAGSETELQEAIENLVLNRCRVADAGYLAQQTALKRPWLLYGQDLVLAISKHQY